MFFSQNKKISNSQKIFDTFKENGIITVEDIIDSSSIAKIKKIITTEFPKINKIEALKLHEVGILELIFNEKVKYLINLIIPDGILWHCII